jgi:5-hydroxyisourate hydrolase
VSLSTHVLDAVRGKPAAGVAVRLESVTAGGSAALARVRTDPDGRVREGLPAVLEPGVYRLVFDTAAYFAEQGVEEFFYPEVVVCFTVADAAAHHHVPLLLSPFAYSTYRGS